jgi:hypothetical protein
MFNKKSYRHLSAGLLVVGSILGCAFQAQAQTVNVPFSGNVPGTCTFGTPIAGTLVKHPILNAVSASSGGLSLLGGGPGSSTGTPGSVAITCQGSSSVTIAVPVGSGPAGFAPATLQALLQRNTSTLPLDLAGARTGTPLDTGGPWNSVTNPSLLLSSGPSTLNVHMAAGHPNNPGPFPAPAPLPLGNYNYTVNLSITGN